MTNQGTSAERNALSRKQAHAGKLILVSSICAVALVYWRWALPGAITWGDWLYLTKGTLADFVPTLWGNATGLGNFQITSAPLFPILALQSLLSQTFNLDYSIVERVLWFYPFVLLSVLSPWCLARTLGYGRVGAAAAILVFALNAYIWHMAGQLTVGMAQVLGPLVMAAFIQTVRRPTAHKGLLLGFVLAVQIVYDIRSSYVTTVMYSLYLLYFVATSRPVRQSDFLRLASVLLLTGMVVITLHSYWLIPLTVDRVGSGATGFLPKGYDDPGWVRALSYMTILHSLGLQIPWWGRPDVVNSPNPQFLFLPVLAFGTMLLRQRPRTLTFFALSALMFSFLVKGSQSPWGEIYIWLFQRMPGFAMFRDPGKWNMPLALSYAALVGYLADRLANRCATWMARLPISTSRLAKAGLLVAGILAWLVISPIQPVSTLRYSLIFDPRPVPEEYNRLEAFLHSQPSFFRTLWLPYHQRFGYYSSQHPALGGVDLGASDLLAPLLQGDPRDWAAYHYSYLTQSFGAQLLRLLSVKYIILPYDSQDDVYVHQRLPPPYYQRLVENIPGLRPVPFDGRTKVYEIADSLPRIYIASNPTVMAGNFANFRSAAEAMLISVPHENRNPLPNLYAGTLAASVVGSPGLYIEKRFPEELRRLTQASYSSALIAPEIRPLLFILVSQFQRDKNHHAAELLTNGDFVFAQNAADLALDLLDSTYRQPPPNFSEISVRGKEGNAYAVFAKAKVKAAGLHGGLNAIKFSPLFVKGGKPIEPDSLGALDQFFLSSRYWRHIGSSGGEPFSFALKKEGDLPLTQWQLLDQRSQGHDLFESTLPEYVPSEFTTRQPETLVTVYRDAAPLRPTWGRWEEAPKKKRAQEKFEELVEIGRGRLRRVVINVPKGQRPTGTYTFSYVVPKLSDEVDEIVVIPLSVLQETADKVLTMLKDSKHRIAYLFTPQEQPLGSDNALRLDLGPSRSRGQEPFYAVSGENHILRARVQPRVRKSRTYLQTGQDASSPGGDVGSRTRGLRPPTAESRGDRGLAIAQEGAVPILFAENWYEQTQDHDGAWRWGRNTMKLLAFNPSVKELTGQLIFRASTIRERDLQLAVNGKVVQTVKLPANYDRRPRSFVERMRELVGGSTLPPYKQRYPAEWTTVTVKDVILKPGGNDIVLSSPQGTDQLHDLLGNEGEPDVSVRVWDDVMFHVVDSRLSAFGDQAFRAINTQVNDLVKDEQQILMVNLDGDRQEAEYVLMSQEIAPRMNGARHRSGADLEQYPRFRLRYKVQDAGLQALGVLFGIDYTGDGVADDYLAVDRRGSEQEGWSTLEVDVFEEAKLKYSDLYYRERRDLRLTRIILVPHKVWGVDAKRTGRIRVYTYILDNPQIYSDSSVFISDHIAGLTAPDGFGRWDVGVENTRYEKRISDDGSLFIGLDLDSRPVVAVSDKEPRRRGLVTFVLKSGKQLSGEVIFEDKENIIQGQVGGEFDGKQITLRKDDISLTFSQEATRRFEYENEEIRLSTRLPSIGPSVTPFLDLTYKVQDPEVQGIDVALGIDTNHDGRTDTLLFPGKRERIEDWTLVGSSGWVDLFETSLSADFPESYTTQRDNVGRFVVLKNGQPMPTAWAGWIANKEQVQVGFGQPRRVVVTVPKGQLPTGEYVVSFLPAPRPSDLYEGYQTLEIDVAQAIRDAATTGQQSEFRDPRSIGSVRVTELVIRLRRLRDADVSGPEKRGLYAFYLKDPIFYRKVAYPGKDQANEQVRRLFTLPLMALDGRPIALKPSDGSMNLLDRHGDWLEPITVHLQEGLHDPGVQFLQHPTFRVDLVELANRPYVPKAVKARVDFRKINPTRYVVNVDAEESFRLVFSESFHEGWRAYVRTGVGSQVRDSRPWYEWSALLTWLNQRGKRIELKDHYQVNAYANGWYVDLKDVPGSGFRVPGEDQNEKEHTRKFQIVLEYQPQRLFEVGLLISGLTLIGCISYLGYDFGKRFRNGNKSVGPSRVPEDL